MLPGAMLLWQVHCFQQIVLGAAFSQAKQRRGTASIFSNAAVQSFHEDARQARRQGISHHALLHTACRTDSIE